MVEEILQSEIDHHLGYEKHSPQGYNSGNSRNGTTSKVVQSSEGAISIEVPRDRKGEFQPELIKKRQTHINAFDDKIISMYSRGMSTRDIQAHVEEMYGANISVCRSKLRERWRKALRNRLTGAGYKPP